MGREGSGRRDYRWMVRKQRPHGKKAARQSCGVVMVRLEAVGLRYDRPGDRPGDRHGDRTTSGAEVLHALSFELPGGAFRWLLGPSGAGKTSLLRLLYLAVRPTSGRLNILDTEVTDPRRRDGDAALGGPGWEARFSPRGAIGRRAAARRDRAGGDRPAQPAAGG